jgi:hypothetical protein
MDKKPSQCDKKKNEAIDRAKYQLNYLSLLTNITLALKNKYKR